MAKIERQLPQRLPIVWAGTYDFEVGFAKEYAVGGKVPVQLLCSICNGIPRDPIELIACGHYMCRACVDHLIGARSEMVCERNEITNEGNCPVCQKRFTSLSGIRPLSDFQPTLRSLYNEIRLRCPFGCGFEGNVKASDDHSVYECPERFIRCPNFNCFIALPSKNMARKHFNKCKKYRTYCSDCRLPISDTLNANHNCLDHYQKVVDDFYRFFRSRGRRIHPLLLKGEPNMPLFELQTMNRQRHGRDAQLEVDPGDMKDCDVVESKESLSDLCILDEI